MGWQVEPVAHAQLGDFPLQPTSPLRQNGKLGGGSGGGENGFRDFEKLAGVAPTIAVGQSIGCTATALAPSVPELPSCTSVPASVQPFPSALVTSEGSVA